MFSSSFSSTELFFFYLSLVFLAFPPLIHGCNLTWVLGRGLASPWSCSFPGVHALSSPRASHYHDDITVTRGGTPGWGLLPPPRVGCTHLELKPPFPLRQCCTCLCWGAGVEPGHLSAVILGPWGGVWDPPVLSVRLGSSLLGAADGAEVPGTLLVPFPVGGDFSGALLGWPTPRAANPTLLPCQSPLPKRWQ